MNVNAIAPFDLERTSFPDSRGPSYKVRGQVRERAARGKVTVSIARGKKKGKFRKIGKAKINSKGRFTKRFTVHKTGVYRLRYTYKGSSLVAGGRVTEQIAHPQARLLRLAVQLCDPAGVSSGRRLDHPRHSTMWRRRIRNAVLASSPTPEPQVAGTRALGQAEARDQVRARVLDAQHLRPARQRAVEEAHVLAARELDRRGAVGDDAREREVARRRARCGPGAARPPSLG